MQLECKVCSNKYQFRFTCGESDLYRNTGNYGDVLSSIVDVSKTCDDSDGPTIVRKENANILLDFLLPSFNATKLKSVLPSFL